MIFDDIIYVSLLLLCVAFGAIYRKVENLHKKQWISTGFGLLIITIVSGKHLVHPLLCVLINAIVITRLSPRICHWVSFFFSFFYLLIIFRLGHLFGLPTPPSHTNLVQMILTLKTSGLAFEINAAVDDTHETRPAAFEKLTFLDIIHYSLSYMGVLTGPYYRYRTYWDSLHRPFVRYVDPWPLTYYKLKQAAVFCILFLIMNYAFPSQYLVSDEYEKLSFILRWLMIYPVWTVFRLRMFSGTIFSECACQMAGLGVYPVKSEPLPGMGPRNYKMIEELCTKTELMEQEKYDFETVHNMSVWEVETCLTIRSCMKHWNSCVQYWMAFHCYKKFPYKSGLVRGMATLILSALWHGYAPGYYICFACIPLYLIFEGELYKLYKQCHENSIKYKIATVIMWIVRLSCMGYLGISFLLLDFNEIIRWYSSLYFIGHVSVPILYLALRCIKPYVQNKETKEQKIE